MRAEYLTAAYAALRASIQERYKGQSQEEAQRLLSIYEEALYNEQTQNRAKIC